VASLIETAQREELVVADRFIASAHALHIHVAGEVAESLRKIAFPCADLTIYLHVAEDERRARLARRGVPLDPFERKLNEDEGFRRQVAERLQGCPRTHLIDTTGLWPSAVAEQAWEVWRVAGRCGHSGLGGRQWSR
jgi:thymidylate kinase